MRARPSRPSVSRVRPFVQSNGAGPMERDAVRERGCRACHARFYVCRSCDRGHRYCCPACRVEGRRRCLQVVRRRHEQSPEARADHRDRQRAYRQRCRQAALAAKSVTDPSSGLPPVSGTVGVELTGVVPVDETTKEGKHGPPIRHVPSASSRPRGCEGDGPRCCRCGRPARYVIPIGLQPFARRQHR